jgi:hypothetical protein
MKGKVVLENTMKCAVTLDFLMFRIWLDDNGDFLLLLIVDGHRSNLRLDFIQNAREANVSVAKLPSHTPLDVSCFKALKTSWDNALVSYQRKMKFCHVSKAETGNILCSIWKSSLSLSGRIQKRWNISFGSL